MVYLLDQMSVPMDLLWHLHRQWQPPPAQLLWLQMGSLLALESLQMGTVVQHQMASRLDLTSVQMVLQYHLLLLLLPMGSSWVQEYLPMVTVEPRQMAYLLDQMSIPMDLLWHLHLQWQPPPAQLLWLQMGSLLALESLQMGTVAQHQMASRLDLTSVQMVLQYHLLLLLLPMGSSWVQEYLPMVTVEQRQMVYLLDQTSVPMDLLWHLHLQWQPQPAQLLWLQMGSLLAQESLQMGTVAQHQMVSRLDLTSVQMVLQYHLLLLLLPMGSSWVQEYLPMVTV